MELSGSFGRVELGDRRKSSLGGTTRKVYKESKEFSESHMERSKSPMWRQEREGNGTEAETHAEGGTRIAGEEDVMYAEGGGTSFSNRASSWSSSEEEMSIRGGREGAMAHETRKGKEESTRVLAFFERRVYTLERKKNYAKQRKALSIRLCKSHFDLSTFLEPNPRTGNEEREKGAPPSTQAQVETSLLKRISSQLQFNSHTSIPAVSFKPPSFRRVFFPSVQTEGE